MDSKLLWLWHRPAAVALIQPLNWKLLYAVGVAIKSKKKKKFTLQLDKYIKYHTVPV